nr:hypothetical protein [Aldersonia kunmingensis]
MRCHGCTSEIEHCHGTLVVHVDRAECTDPGCADLHADRHTFVVECFDVAGGCACRAAVQFRRAAV